MDDIDKLAAAMGVKMIEADLPGSNISIEEVSAMGWKYIDPPTWFSPDMWGHFLRVLGDGEYKILVMTKCPRRGVRGQFFISPKAFESLKNHALSQKPVADGEGGK
jgi:hypothetical protein